MGVTLAAGMLLAVGGGCRSAGWRTPQEETLRGELLRVATRVIAAEPMLLGDRDALSAVPAAIQRAAPEFSSRHRVFFWRGEGWVLEFDALDAEGRVFVPGEARLPEAGALRALSLQVAGAARGSATRVTLLQDRKELRRRGATAVTAYYLSETRLARRSDVKRAMIRIVDAEAEFWQSPVEVVALVEEIRRQPGTKDVESSVFEWRRGRLAAGLDCAHIRMPIKPGPDAGAGRGTYYINAARLIVFDRAGKLVRTLKLTADEGLLTEYGPTVLRARPPGGAAPTDK